MQNKCKHGRNEMFCCDCRYGAKGKSDNMDTLVADNLIVMDTYEAIDEKRFGTRLIEGALLLRN